MEALATAEHALRCRDPVTALDPFDAVLEASPDDLDARAGYVRAHWMMRRETQAYGELDSLLVDAPGAVPVLVAQGTVLLGFADDLVHTGIVFGSARRSTAEAILAFEQATDLDATSVQAWRGLARARRLAGQLFDAQVTLDKAEGAAGWHPSYGVERAWCAFDRWDLEHAYALIDETLLRATDDIEALLAASFMRRQSFDLAGAAEALDKVAAHDLRYPVALQTEYGWLDYYESFTLPDPAEQTGARSAAAHHFAVALEADPAHPSALEGSYAVDEQAADEAIVVALDAAAARSPTLLAVRGSALTIGGYEAEGLALLYDAVESDPYMLRARIDLAGTLRQVGRHDDARNEVAKAAAACPRDPRAATEEGWLEYEAGRFERALELFERLGPEEFFGEGQVGRAAAFRALHCFDLAEEAAQAGVQDFPGSPPHCREYALVAYEDGRWQTATERLDWLLKIHADPSVRSLYRHAKWRARILGSLRRKVEWGLGDVVAIDESSRTLIEDSLGEPVPLRLRGRLHDLNRQLASISRWRTVILDDLWLRACAVLAIPLLLGYPVALQAFPAVQLRPADYLWLVTAGLLAVVALTWLIRSRNTDLASVWVLGLATAVVLGAFSALVVLGRPVEMSPVLVATGAVGFAVAIWWLVFAVGAATGWWFAHRERVVRNRCPDACMVHDLVTLFTLLDYDEWFADPQVRRTCLDLLDNIATSQQRTLLQVWDDRPGRRRGEEEVDGQGRTRAAGVAAETRALQHWVLTPGPQTREDLRERVQAMLVASCRGEWDSLGHREPPPTSRVVRTRILHAARTISIALLLPAALLVYELTPWSAELPLPLPLQLGGYVLWPLANLLLWLDPEASKRLDFARQIGEALEPRPRSSGAK